MRDSDVASIGNKILHAMTQWLLSLYKWIGADYLKPRRALSSRASN
jgi:hypothetical protein